MKNKGFTLIELLAVIVILAIIALIAVPIILNIINDARIESNEMSKELYLTAVENAVARKNLNEEFKPDTCEVDDTGNLTCIIDDKEIKLLVEVNGTRPTSGTINFINNAIGFYTLVINGKTYTHSYVKDGLVLWLDGISNTRDGHDESATVWEDLSGNNNDATLMNYDNPTWNETSLTFDGINQYAQILNYNNSPYTIETVFSINKFSNSAMGLFCISRNGNNSNGVAIINKGYAIRNYYGWGDNKHIDTPNYKMVDHKIFNATSLNFGNDGLIYINSELKVQKNISNDTIIDNVILGNAMGNEYLNGNIYSIRVYNRGLSEEEIKQNYEVDKKRFGILE